MNSPPLCPACQQPLPDAAPQGLCPACVMKAALHAEPAVPAPTEHELADLAQAFPQLVIEALIGTGGMGRVYRAQQPHLNRTVALKVLTPERAADPEWLERFNREARALARLSHPHIVQVYDFGESPVPYLLMEYVEGVNLRQAMQNGALSAREALTIVPKLCDALQYAHEHGVLHRDLKPENVLIDTEGRVKLVDFGLAKLREEGVLPFTLTQSGAQLGTLAYMAPEQIEKPADVDHRADIYSLGVVFYEMLTGELPLGRFPSPSEASGVDPRLDSVVLRTLEKRREKRFNDAGEMKTELSRCEVEEAAPEPVSLVVEWSLLVVSTSLWMAGVFVSSGFVLESLSHHSREIFGVVLVVLGLLLSWFICVQLRARKQFHGVISVAAIALAVVPFLGVTTSLVSSLLMAQQPAEVRAMILRSLVSACTSFVKKPVELAGIYLLWLWWKNSGPQRNPQRPRPTRALVITALIALLLPFVPVLFFFSNKPQSSSNTTSAPRQPTVDERRMEADKASIQRAKRVGEQAQAWVVKMSRTGNDAALEEVCADLLAAIQSNDDEKREAAMLAVSRAKNVNYNKESLGNVLRTLLGREMPAQKKGLLISALMSTKPNAQDEEQLLAMIPDCDDRLIQPLLWAVSEFSHRDYTGRFSAPALSLLERGMALAQKRDADGVIFDSRELLNPLWGGMFSPELEAKLVEWSRLDAGLHGEMRVGNLSRGYNAFYYALSPQANKKTAAVKRLLELLQHPDNVNVADRCLWGLHGTVSDPHDQAEVVAAVIALLRDRSDASTWRYGLAVLRDYARAEHREAVERLATQPGISAENQQAMQEVLTRTQIKP